MEWEMEAPYKNNRVKVYCGCCGKHWKCASENFTCVFYGDSDADVSSNEYNKSSSE